MKPNFQLFDPKTMDGSQLPAMPGNYVFLLRQGSKLHLPAGMVNPQLSTITLDGKEYQVIYTGKASKSLRTRDFKQHFEGNDASRSTLRKSLGCLMGFTFVPRNGTPNVRYKKFCPEDERKLSEWMREHLLLAYTVNPNPIFMERDLIEKLNPPLNLADNTNAVNRDFRARLSQLRSRPFGEGYPAPILRDGQQNEHVAYETSSWLVRMYLKRKGFLFFCSVEILLIFGLSLALFFDLKGLYAFELVSLFVIMGNVLLATIIGTKMKGLKSTDRIPVKPVRVFKDIPLPKGDVNLFNEECEEKHCPYCGSNFLQEMVEDKYYICNDCGNIWNKEDL